MLPLVVGGDGRRLYFLTTRVEAWRLHRTTTTNLDPRAIRSMFRRKHHACIVSDLVRRLASSLAGLVFMQPAGALSELMVAVLIDGFGFASFFNLTT